MLQFRYGRLHLDTLGDCHFPKLRTLVIGISLTPPIATFISRCRELRLLCLFPIIDDQHTHIPPIGPLPQLQVFKGTNQFLSSVIPGSPVNSVAISMDIHGTFDSVLDELKKSTTPITDIEYTAPGWDFLDFFTGLLCQFPDIESIKYYSIMPLPLILRGVRDIVNYIGFYKHLYLAAFSQIFMARLVHLLPGFTQLRHLEITDFYVLRNEQDDGLDHIEDPEYADIWWSVCPQLVSCRLPSMSDPFRLVFFRSQGNILGAIQWLRNPEAKHLRDRWYPDHHDARTRAWLRNISRGDLSQFDWITNLIDALGIPQDLRSESTDKKSDDGGGEANGSEGGEEGSSDGGNDS